MRSMQLMRCLKVSSLVDTRKTLRKLITEKSSDFVFLTPENKLPSSMNHMLKDLLKAHNLLIDPNTNKKRVYYNLCGPHSTAVLNMDSVDLRSLVMQLGNSPEIIRKHYDRADRAAITPRVKAPNARNALFRKVSVPQASKLKKYKKRWPKKMINDVDDKIRHKPSRITFLPKNLGNYIEIGVRY